MANDVFTSGSSGGQTFTWSWSGGTYSLTISPPQSPGSQVYGSPRPAPAPDPYVPPAPPPMEKAGPLPSVRGLPIPISAGLCAVIGAPIWQRQENPVNHALICYSFGYPLRDDIRQVLTYVLGGSDIIWDIVGGGVSLDLTYLDGSQTQADLRMAEQEGAAHTPAYKGQLLALISYDDLAAFGGAAPKITGVFGLANTLYPDYLFNGEVVVSSLAVDWYSGKLYMPLKHTFNGFSNPTMTYAEYSINSHIMTGTHNASSKSYPIDKLDGDIVRSAVGSPDWQFVPWLRLIFSMTARTGTGLDWMPALIEPSTGAIVVDGPGVGTLENGFNAWNSISYGTLAMAIPHGGTTYTYFAHVMGGGIGVANGLVVSRYNTATQTIEIVYSSGANYGGFAHAPDPFVIVVNMPVLGKVSADTAEVFFNATVGGGSDADSKVCRATLAVQADLSVLVSYAVYHASAVRYPLAYSALTDALVVCGPPALGTFGSRMEAVSRAGAVLWAASRDDDGLLGRPHPNHVVGPYVYTSYYGAPPPPACRVDTVTGDVVTYDRQGATRELHLYPEYALRCYNAPRGLGLFHMDSSVGGPPPLSWRFAVPLNA